MLGMWRKHLHTLSDDVLQAIYALQPVFNLWLKVETNEDLALGSSVCLFMREGDHTNQLSYPFMFQEGKRTRA